MAEEVNSRHPETALGRVDGQSEVAEALTQLTEVDAVLLPRATGHEYVVQVDKDEVQAAAHTVQKPGKGLRSVLQTKRHPYKFE